MVGKLSQPGCHTNTGARSGRSLVKLGEIPDNNRQRRCGRSASMPVMRGQARKPEKKPKSGKKVLGRSSSLLIFSSKRVNPPPVQDKKETCQLALRTFRRMRNAASSSRSPMQVLVDLQERYSNLVLRHCDVGHVPWVEVGDRFECRAELRLVGLHNPPVAGIHWMDIDSGCEKISVALSIVLSGGYEDDLDEGETLTYTGEGGQNDRKQQIADQRMEGGNNALRNSYYMKKSVRVIRRQPDSSIPGGALFSYDGLYKVVRWEEAVGLSNFLVYKFKLVREGNQKPLRWQSPVSSRRRKVSRGFESPPRRRSGDHRHWHTT